MGDWRDFPLPDGSYSDDTRPFSQQDVVNYLPTFAEAQGTRSRAKYKTVPGLAHFANVGDGPHRGARDVEGKAFIVSGRKLYQVAVDGTATEIGTIPGTGRVSMTHNQIAGGNQLIMATGDNSYVYDTVTETLAATGVALVCVDFLNQRILGVDQARRFWRYSGVATATSWEELDNESAESSPDRIVGGIVSQGEWLVFGERTIEVFSNSPTEATAFIRSQVIEKGCANANTICRLDNSVMWVGNDGVPYRLNGYTPVPIASKAIIDTISSGNPRKLSAFTWEDKGYVCYYVTAQDGYTFGYDVSSGKWHRRESYGFDRWRINTLFKWNNAWYAGDFQNGRMYRLEWGYVYEGCEIMPRVIRTGVLHNNGNRVTVHGFRLGVATGGVKRGPAIVAAAPTLEPPPITWMIQSESAGRVYVSPDEDGATWPTSYQTTTSYNYVTPIDQSLVFTTPTIGSPAAKYTDDYGPTIQTLTGFPGTSQPPLILSSGRIVLLANTNIYYSDTGKFGPWTTVALGFSAEAIAGDDNCLIATNVTERKISTDGGLTWGASLPNSLFSASALGYSKAQGMFVFGTGSSGGAFRWTTDGITLTACTGTFVGASGQSVTMLPLDDGSWICAVSQSADNTGSNILRSADGKAGWGWVTTPACYFQDTGGQRIAARGGVVIAAPTSSALALRIIRSTDYGVTFAPVAHSMTGFSVLAGVGVAAFPAPPDPAPALGCTEVATGGFLQLRYSIDGSENWSNWRDFAQSVTGSFLQPFIARRLGMARHRVWEIMDTSDTAQDVLAASIIVESE